MNKDGIPSDRRSRGKVFKKSEPKVHSQRTATSQSLVQPPLPKTEFRERLIARLDQAEVPAHKRMAYVAELTGRAVQTVSRWFDAGRPGLPDLESYVRLCTGLHCNASWMLGLSVTPGLMPGPPAGSGNAEAVWMDSDSLNLFQFER